MNIEGSSSEDETAAARQLREKKKKCDCNMTWGKIRVEIREESTYQVAQNEVEKGLSVTLSFCKYRDWLSKRKQLRLHLS